MAAYGNSASQAPDLALVVLANSTAFSTMEPNASKTNMSECYENQYCTKEEYLQAMYEWIAPKPEHYVFVVLNIVVFIVGLVGNFLVCFAVWRNHHMRTVTNYFIVNLALADFMVILICLPASLVEDMRHTWYIGLTLCKIIKALQVSPLYILRSFLNAPFP